MAAADTEKVASMAVVALHRVASILTCKVAAGEVEGRVTSIQKSKGGTLIDRTHTPVAAALALVAVVETDK